MRHQSIHFYYDGPLKGIHQRFPCLPDGFRSLVFTYTGPEPYLGFLLINDLDKVWFNITKWCMSDRRNLAGDEAKRLKAALEIINANLHKGREGIYLAQEQLTEADLGEFASV